jgi:hypothetical protein
MIFRHSIADTKIAENGLLRADRFSLCPAHDQIGMRMKECPVSNYTLQFVATPQKLRFPPHLGQHDEHTGWREMWFSQVTAHSAGLQGGLFRFFRVLSISFPHRSMGTS